jgi:hypothetical protein
MSTLRLVGDSSGYVQLVANVAAANNTLTLPNVNDTLANITSPTFLSNIALAGTGTAPSIGLFTPSANTLAFATNTTQVLTINSTGNVGIGSSTPQQTLDVQGNVNVLNTVIMGSSFLRNRLINGAMQIDQRSNGASFTMTASTYGSYGSCDRWNFGNSNASGCVAQRVTSTLAGFPYALQIQRSSTSTVTGFFGTAQDIETLNCQDLAGQTVTLSFYAQAGANFSAASNLMNVFVATGTGTDQSSNLMWTSAWTGFAKPLNTTATLTTTWTRYSYTVVIPAGTNEIAAAFYYTPTGTAGTADYFQITGVQLEPGPVATAFERKLYSQVLADCQRYYWVNSSASNNVSYYMPVFAYSTTLAFGVIEFPVTMRIAPAIVTSGTSANYRIYLGGTAYTLTAGPAIDQATPYSSSISFTTAGTLTLGQAGMAGANASTAAFIGFNAEL